MELIDVNKLTNEELISISEELQQETFSEDSIIRKLSTQYFGSSSWVEMISVAAVILPIMAKRFKSLIQKS